ncbi:MAG: alpha/beta hydrolase [Acidimicrobiales bacterium]|nr:alpha/beta hydrolase [Acidimicrobiales bacterium]
MAPDKKHPWLKKVVGVATVAGIAAAVAARTAEKRWAVGQDMVEGDPLGLPKGKREILTLSNGAKVSMTIYEGSGPTVLMSHGWTETQAVWAPVVRQLVDKGQGVVVYDHQGHGGSTIGIKKLDVNQLASDMEEVINSLGDQELILVGHSMGGMTAQTFMVNQSQASARVVGLLLVATASSAAFGPDFFYQAAASFVGSKFLESALENDSFAAWFTRLVVGKQAHMTHLLAVRDMFLSCDSKARSELAQNMSYLDLTDELTKLTVPTIVMVGDRDTLTPLRCAKEITSHIPGSRLEILPDLGHMLPFEAPDRVFENIISLSSTLP